METAKRQEESNHKGELALGCWAFGNGYWIDQDHRDSIKVIHHALRSGITHFDTAQVYGSGRSEQITGQQLKRFKEIPREHVRINTKILMPPRELLSPDYRPELDRFIRKKVRLSLNRLITPYIDTLFIHWPKTGADPRPVMEVLENLRYDGLIRKIGASNFPTLLMASLCDAGTLDVCQCAYSLLWTQPDTEILPFCRARKIRTEAYSPLAQGALTGKFPASPDFDPRDRRKQLIFFRDDVWPHLFPLIQELSSLAKSLSRTNPPSIEPPAPHPTSASVTPASLALAWLLQRRGIDTVLIGARTKSQLTDLLTATKTADLLAANPSAKERLDRLAVQAMQYYPKSCSNIFQHST